jgi:hypothetical protein
MRTLFNDKEVILIVWRLAVIIGFAGWLVVGSVLGFMVNDIYGRVAMLEKCSPGTFEQRISHIENNFISKSEVIDALKVRDDVRNSLITRMERIDVENKQDHMCISSKLESIKNTLFNANDDLCPICMGELNDKPTMVDCCGHKYCFECITLIMTNNNTCPMCQAKISQKKIF